MQAREILLRIVKWLGKAMLGLLFVLLIIVALLHLPPVQQQITHKVSDYLSSKLEAKVAIQRIDFSLLGNVAIENLEVWDPNAHKIFSVHKIEATTHIPDLIKGDLIFDEVHLAGVDWQLIQGKDGLNIQFIIDAFTSKEKRTPTQSTSVTLQFKKILLENIVFEFTSTVSGTSVAVNLGTFNGQAAEFSTHPLTIKADKIFLQHTVVNTLSIRPPDTINTTVASDTPKLLSPDFGTGIIFEIKDLELKDDAFSFHQDQVTTTRKFDPAHLSLTNIQVKLSDVLMRKDTLAAGIHALAAQLPGFEVADAEASLRMNQNQLALAGLHITSGNNELMANLTAPNDFKFANDDVYIDVAAHARINPNDLAYFLSDSVINQFNWGTTELTIEGNYAKAKGELKTLQLKTRNSQLQVKGLVHDITDLEKIYWKDLMINASIGADFKRTFTSYLRTINLPPAIRLQLSSSGNPKKLYADGKVFTTWGDVKAVGGITQQTGNVGMDMNLTGENVDLGKWMSVSSLGPMDLSVDAKGRVGNDTHVEISGMINNIEILDQPIHDIAFQSTARKDNATIAIAIKDPNYRSEIGSEISFAAPLMFTNTVHLDSFKLGLLLHRDSTLFISGDTKSKVIIDSASLQGYVEGERMVFRKQSIEYSLDTLSLHALISTTKSAIEYYADNAKANLVSNFDIRNASEVIQQWTTNILNTPDTTLHLAGNRTATLNMELEDASFIKLLGMEVDDFATLRVTGEFDEQEQTAALHASSGKFKGYGISLDTLQAQLTVLRDSIDASMNATHLFYNTFQLGNLDFDMMTKGDTAISNLLLSNDTITLVGLRARILPTDSGAFVYTDHLQVLDHDYFMDPENSVHIGNKNLVLNHFLISRDSMHIRMEGDLNGFDVSLRQVDLTPLNYLISPDTTLINKGHLTGTISYSPDHQLNLKAHIDSLSLYNSNPLAITATAVSDGNQVPFEFLLTNASNKVDLKGDYFSDNAEVDASLLLDVNNLELFGFLVSGFVEEMKGTLQGEAAISGSIQKPALKGYLKFLDVGITTVNPRLTFLIPDDSITLDNSTLSMKDFTLYDLKQNPLTINGSITSKDYQSYAYDLHINSDHYALINNPDSTTGKLRGTLVIDSDIKLNGNEKDTNVEANITIKDATDLTMVNAKDEIELLKAEGIIDFIDPALLLDSAALEPSANLYDSLIASLPDFNLNSTITIEDNAKLRLMIDEQSGDYIEASGAANLELGYDRTGNLRLNGNYTIKKGVYRLSFYDLVKKNFTLVQGSSINWSGSPKNGDVNIKAVHTVESNSLGLIGHEIGENEKSIYKRSLDYEVGINITGPIEKPIVSFSLDLPKEEKVSYPVLANKLDRLRQPEYASELNKQVFGLLVLGGFLPESSADVNSSVIATTALSNSVNSLLASQLNRFASQYIKGVNIDVGIQSFSDYSAPGGKTQTAMDFRVSKKIMNDRLAFEIGGDFDINQDQSGANTGTKNYRGDIAIIYDLTGNGDKQLKLFNNETYDIIYQEIRNTGISLIFIREFENKEKNKNK